MNSLRLIDNYVIRLIDYSQHGSAGLLQGRQAKLMGVPQFSDPCSSKTPWLILMKFVNSDYVVDPVHTQS